MTNEISIFWFRRDLRIEDNHGLYQALRNAHPVLCIFIFDKNILDKIENKTDLRVQFIHDSLSAINSQLAEVGSSLLTIYGTPLEVFTQLIRNYKISSVFTNHDYEPYAIQRDQAICQLLKENNILWNSHKDQVIFEKKEILKSDASPYTVFTPYANAWKKKMQETGKPDIYPSQSLLSNTIKKKLRLLDLEEIGFTKKMDYTFSIKKIKLSIIKNYEETRNFPAIKGTSELSIHLRFGTVSVRKLVSVAKETNETWLNELIWREFFMMLLYHFPYVEYQAFKPKYRTIEWRNNEKEFQAWCKGETGYPIVDAGMRELNATGLMHNRVRMITASFLIKHLLIDWKWGEAYFAEKLLDFDLSANNGNWQWVAGCGCDAAPYYRIFNPTEQQKKFDPEFKYIKKWIPDFDNYAIEPIVDHSFARQRFLDTMKKLT